MKKILSLLILLALFVSCSQEVSFNNNAMQAQRDGLLWRSQVAQATVGTGGSLTIQTVTQFEVLTFNTSAVTPGTYILGNDYTNKVTYDYSAEGSPETFVTGNGIGRGKIIITEYDIVNKTVSGTFNFTVVNDDPNSTGAENVIFNQGYFYKIPVTTIP